MDEKEEEALLLAMLLDEPQIKKRRIWIQNVNKDRESKGEFHRLYPKLRENAERFYEYFRMSVECFDEILSIIEPDIKKKFTNFRRPIQPRERLAVTLRYLATGDSCRTIGHNFRMGFTTVNIIVLEVCTAIWNRMQPLYIPEPNRHIWEATVAGFNEKCQFPNCLGVIDAKRITIRCPKKTGSLVLLSVVDHDNKFICIDVGEYGKNDGGIFEESTIGQKFNKGTFDLPENRSLPNQNEFTPCVLIGDEGFSLKEYLIRPFPRRQARTDLSKEKFNNSLSRVRSVVENGFGILSHKWRVLFRPIEIHIDKAIIVVKTICVLHNYLRSKSSNQMINLLNDGEQPVLSAFRNYQIDSRRPTRAAVQIRENFVSFVNN